MASKDVVEPVNNYGRFEQKRSSKPEGPAPHRRGCDPEGRYDRRRDRTWHPSEGLARMPVSANADTTVAAVIDPYGDGEERILATVNRRVDILETERSHERISEAAYQTGRILQQVFERATRIGGSNFEGGSRRDPREVRIHLMARRVVDAKEAIDLEERLRGRLGVRYVRILRRIIGDGMTYAQAAAYEGKAGPRGTTFIAESFRCALEDAVAAVQQSRGAAAPAQNDEHTAAAEVAKDRQAASIGRGATLARLEGELDDARRCGAGKGAIAEIEVAIQRLRISVPSPTAIE